MGWKLFKQHYGIEANVEIEKGLVCIGTGYIDLLKVSMDGQIEYAHQMGTDHKIYLVQQAIKADPETAARLLKAEDTFERSIRVYTYEGAEILEKFCEEEGYPNVTHDGLMMYVREFSSDRNEIIQRALTVAKANAHGVCEAIGNVEKNLLELKSAQEKYDDQTAILTRMANGGVTPVEAAVAPRTVVSIKGNVYSFDEVESQVCKVLEVKNLRADSLGFDFWLDIWCEVDDDRIDCRISENLICIDDLIEEHGDKEEHEVVRVLAAFKQVLGDEPSRSGVYFQY